MATLVIIPGSPALVPELAPRDAAGAELLDHARTALGQSARALSVHVGRGLVPVDVVGSQAPRWHTCQVGSFAAWGAPQVRVAAGEYLAELVARYVVEPVDGVEVRSMRECLGTPDPQALTVVVADGSAGMGTRAPLADLPQASAAHAWCCGLLSARSDHTKPSDAPAGEWDEEQLMEAGVVEPAIWLELAELSCAGSLRQAELLGSDTSLGVGRYVARWEVD